MKVAGSSWLPWPLAPVSAVVLLAIASSVVDASLKSDECAALDRNGLANWETESNLINELAVVSKDMGEVSNVLEDDLLQSYEATPFWYNLIQAISLASGITPTTEVLMHDLATSSFRSDSLNNSIKKVLSMIKCNETYEADGLDSGAESGGVQPQVIALDVADAGDNTHRASTLTGGADPKATEVDRTNFASAVPWSPWDQLAAATWHPEQERQENSLVGPVSLQRLRRELRDRRRGDSAMADLHQPFFMSENLPSSLVTRHPSIISVSGCPSGHIQDLRGMCRQIFQYTVNYGGAGSPGAGAGPPSARAAVSRPPWLFNRPPLRRQQRPHGGTLRDLARESSLFKHSVMRGYVPPFIYSDFLMNRNSDGRKELNRNTDVLGAPASSGSLGSVAPQPVEVMQPMPQIVVMGDVDPATITLLPDSASEGSRSSDQDSKDEWRSKGGGSSETGDSSKDRSRDERKREEKALKKSKDKYQTTTRSSNDDDD